MSLRYFPSTAELLSDISMALGVKLRWWKLTTSDQFASNLYNSLQEATSEGFMTRPVTTELEGIKNKIWVDLQLSGEAVCVDVWNL